MHRRPEQHVVVSQAQSCLFVRDRATDHWHIAAGLWLPAAHGWALCGAWPDEPRAGWALTSGAPADLEVHDVCRYWAGLGNQWWYARGRAREEWHVLPAPTSGARPLCGDLGWVVCVSNPAGLPLHEACRAQRDERDRALLAAWLARAAEAEPR